MTKLDQNSPSSRDKVLIISYFFPPLRAAGAARIVGQIKYLVQAGWDISVITVAASPDIESDLTTLNKLPAGVDVIRTRSFEIGWLLNAVRGRSRQTTSADNGDQESASRGISSLIKLPLRIVYRICKFPDKWVGWLPPLLVTTWNTIREGRHSVVISTSPPHSSHLVPAFLKTFLGFRWIADFRDGWTAPPYRGIDKGLGARTARILESFVLRRCDRIIANTDGNKSELLATFSFLDDKKITVITNGFDIKTPLQDVDILPDETDCDIMHLGEVYSQVFDLLIYPLASIKQRDPARLPRIFMYGNLSSEILTRFREAGLADHVISKGWVAWDKSIHIMRRATSLFLMLPHTRGGSTTVPSKLYAYLFSGRPIMLIGPPGDAATLVQTVGKGMAITDKDPDKIAEGMLSFVDAVRQGVYAGPIDHNKLRPYTMEQTAQRLNSLLTETLGRAST